MFQDPDPLSKSQLRNAQNWVKNVRPAPEKDSWLQASCRERSCEFILTPMVDGFCLFFILVPSNLAAFMYDEYIFINHRMTAKVKYKTLSYDGRRVFIQSTDMVDGRKTRVTLIDDRQLDIIVQPRLTVDELLNIVASHCYLKDPDKQYFGLAFLDDKQQIYWLQNERRVLDHEFPKKFCVPGATLILYHLIRLFVDSITHIAHPSTAELFFLHASSQIHKGLIIADSVQIIKLAAFMTQIYYGDFTDEEKVLTLYKSLVGTPRGLALVRYMEIVERVPTYGIHFFEDKLGNNHDLGISRLGIYQYSWGDKTKPVKGFQWRQLENLYYRDKKFSMEIHESKRVMHTASSFSIYDEMNHNSFDESDDLIVAVRDPTTQLLTKTTSECLGTRRKSRKRHLWSGHITNVLRNQPNAFNRMILFYSPLVNLMDHEITIVKLYFGSDGRGQEAI
uniref:FERM domain-containing protein n=1 Tax=Romanomermis culicivorax TaxID=13658 RepID=A0A915KMY0_ROMCU